MNMKEKILSIASDLRKGSMSTEEAKKQLLILFRAISSLCACGRRDINILSGICDICWNEKFPNEQDDY
jgi:hypothetical protein